MKPYKWGYLSSILKYLYPTIKLTQQLTNLKTSFRLIHRLDEKRKFTALA